MTEKSFTGLLPRELHDVIIIGGGPAGLSAAMYAARAQLKTVVLDKNPASGALGTADKIENYPGVPQKMKGSELLSLFREQAQKFGAEIVSAQVMGVNFEKDTKEVTTSDKIYYGKTVIIATGAMGRTPTIKGELEFTGRGVSYCAVCDAPFFKGKDVAVVGDIDAITEEIDEIIKFSRKVYVLSRKGDSKHTESFHTNPHITVMPHTRVVEILGSHTVTGVKIADFQGNEKTLDVSGVFIYLHGNKPITDFLYSTVDTTDDGCIRVSKEDMSTSLEGVYAAGDVTCKKFRQVIIAAAEGCSAALSADRYINKRQKVRPQWS